MYVFSFPFSSHKGVVRCLYKHLAVYTEKYTLEMISYRFTEIIIGILLCEWYRFIYPAFYVWLSGSL